MAKQNKQKTLIYFLFGVVSIVILYYSFQGGESIDDYESRVMSERQRQEKFLRFNSESPFNVEDAKAEFKPLSYYPINTRYKVKARLTPVQNQKLLELPMTDGSQAKYIKYAIAQFELGGRTHELLLLQDFEEKIPGKLFLAFADETSARETYGGGRYLDVTLDTERSATLDFNLAYNPYCAYNADFACPLPPKENLLTVAIEAGEKKFE
ncbi:DUF1684 domain-containing protein [Penaeicola halotolerans]|uniref:DUF1684 domain-containing protein n=1 Tax=Penaeicola halotolerans TaxID=2793196 RepID=UPI001CF8CBB7|nr:DUF1684 domain-containing protein [Penaeicola halotolerans]